MADEEIKENWAVESGTTKTITFKVEITSPDAYAYSNVSSVALSPWDVRINFADVNPSMDEPDAKTKAFGGIVMPPEHAAGLVMLLTTQLQQFEQQFGPIRHPKWRALAAAQKKHVDEKAEQAKKSEGKPAKE